MIHEVMGRLVGAVAWEWWEMESTRLSGVFFIYKKKNPSATFEFLKGKGCWRRSRVNFICS
jgi:hypothetical protein